MNTFNEKYNEFVKICQDEELTEKKLIHIFFNFYVLFSFLHMRLLFKSDTMQNISPIFLKNMFFSAFNLEVWIIIHIC